MKTLIVGYPRIGEDRELKFAIEKYWRSTPESSIILCIFQNLLIYGL